MWPAPLDDRTRRAVGDAGAENGWGAAPTFRDFGIQGLSTDGFTWFFGSIGVAFRSMRVDCLEGGGGHLLQ